MILPRAIRLKDAPAYLGMDKNIFNRDVRPFVSEIPIGAKGIAFDRLDLDAWFDDYKSCNERPARHTGEKLWDVKQQGYTREKESGILINKSKDLADFQKAVKRVTMK